MFRGWDELEIFGNDDYVPVIDPHRKRPQTFATARATGAEAVARPEMGTVHGTQKVMAGEIKKGVAQHVQRHPGMGTGIDVSAHHTLPFHHYDRVLLLAVDDGDILGLCLSQVLDPAQHTTGELIGVGVHVTDTYESDDTFAHTASPMGSMLRLGRMVTDSNKSAL